MLNRVNLNIADSSLALDHYNVGWKKGYFAEFCWELHTPTVVTPPSPVLTTNHTIFIYTSVWSSELQRKGCNRPMLIKCQAKNKPVHCPFLTCTILQNIS